MSDARYFSAQVCKRGHFTNYAIERHPNLLFKYCDQCGAETIRTCPQCGIRIHGKLDIEGIGTGIPKRPGWYCYNCGKPYPWTEGAISNLSRDIDGLRIPTHEKEELKKSIQSLLVEGDDTKRAIELFQNAIIADKNSHSLVQRIIAGISSIGCRIVQVAFSAAPFIFSEKNPPQ